MEKPIKLGVIGCGIAANELHWPALQKLTDKFEITAVCNHTEPKAKSFAEKVGGVPYVLDYRDLLKRDDTEAVDIILPIELNCQVTKDALEAGKHVIVEKPLAVNLEQAKKMLALESKHSQVMMVGENFRYRNTFSRIKEYLENGEIGRPYAVFWNLFHRVDEDNKYAKTKWRINHQYEGGFITDGGVHNIAALRDLFGDFVSVHAFSKSINRKIGKLDSLSLQFKTIQNIDGLFNTFFSANGYAENRIIILGDQGSYIIEGNTIIKKANDKKDIVEKMDDDGGYIGEFDNFYQAIRNGEPVIASFQKSYDDFKTILTALESAEKEQHIKLK